MENTIIKLQDEAYKGFWDGYNNIGIGVVAIASVLKHSNYLSIPKALLIIPMIIHRPTLRFMMRKDNLGRGSAVLASNYPELFADFNQRFESCLPLSLNSIQFLVHLGYAQLGEQLVQKKVIEIDANFGQRAHRISTASKKISELLIEQEEELYLNFRIQL